MTTDPVQQLIDQALQMLSAGRQFSAGVYTSPEIYEREKQHIFKREWLPVGRVEHFDNPGDYRAARIVGEPILVCRDEAGGLNAFRNVCRHRGVEVAVGQGSAESFLCPYHGWEYGLDGHLLSATYPEDLKGYDLRQCKLPRLKLETWAGFVFVNFDESAPSLRERYGDVLDVCDFLKMEDMREAHSIVLSPECNWKLINENVFDVYHLGVVHASSFARDFDPRAFKLNSLARGTFYGNYRSQSLAGPNGKTLLGAIPWLDVDEDFAFAAQILPTFSMLSRHDAVYAITVEPLGPDKCRFYVSTLFPKDWFHRPDFAEKAEQYAKFIRIIFEEDYHMLQSIQVGLKSDCFVPGPATALETPVHLVTKNILEQISAG